ncbi:RNA polymerase II elongation factor ELL2-like [Cavia porcellus]|uniref:RNA polymerase II elongation factor ELL2-like n=1 Tax=Cavia porcellus TaxID=10141 RepID=UPI000350C3F5|nr:RNA polymerase II elongation factor ELL2-like [Cavia porcellus]
MTMEKTEPRQQDIIWFPIGSPESVIQADHFYQNPNSALPQQVSPQFQSLPGLSKASPNDSSTDWILLNSQLSNKSNDNHQDRTDHRHHTISHPGCLPSIQDKMMVDRGNNLYAMITEGKHRAEEKSCDKWQHPRKLQIQKTTPIRKAPKLLVDPAPLRKRTAPINPAYTIRKSRVPNRVNTRSFRERVLHLLALKEYSESELLIQMQKDGIKEYDKNTLRNILHEVANFNYQNCSYSLKDCAFKEIQKDWPGYSEIDRQALEMMLSNKVCQLNKPSPTSNSSRDITPSPTDHFLNLIGANNFTTRQLNISHSPTTTQSTSHSHLNNNTESYVPKTKDFPEPLTPTYMLTSCSPLSVNSSSSSCSTPKSPQTKDLYIQSFIEDSKIFNSQTNKHTSSELSNSLSDENKHLKIMEKKYLLSEKKSKNKFTEHKAHSQNYNVDMMDTQKADYDRQEERPSSNSSKNLQKDNAASRNTRLPLVSPDYFYDYCTILSSHQRHQYEQEFTANYDEYYALHCKILDVTRSANELEWKRQFIFPGSKQYLHITKKILAEHQKIQQIYPNWYEDYYRCSYLYHKLAHIKNLIIAFDQNT